MKSSVDSQFMLGEALSKSYTRGILALGIACILILVLHQINSIRSVSLYEGNDVYDLQKRMASQRDAASRDCVWQEEDIDLSKVIIGKVETLPSRLGICMLPGKSPFGESGYWLLKRIGPFRLTGNDSVQLQTPDELVRVSGKMRSYGLSIMKENGDIATLPDFHLHHCVVASSSHDTANRYGNFTATLASTSDFECPDADECRDALMQVVFPKSTVYSLDSREWSVDGSNVWVEDFRNANSPPVDVYVQMSAFILHDTNIRVKRQVYGMYAMNYKSQYLPIDKHSIGWTSIQFNSSVEFFHVRPHSHGMVHSILAFKGLPGDLGLGVGEWRRDFYRHYLEIPGEETIEYALNHVLNHHNKSNSTELLCHFRQFESRLEYSKGIFQRFNVQRFRECIGSSWTLRAHEPITVVGINYPPGRDGYVQHNVLFGWFLTDSADTVHGAVLVE